MGYINKIQIDSDSIHLIEPTLFAITKGTASAYIAEISNFELTSGVNIYLQVHNNNEQNATLNINNLGEKDIFYKNSNIVANQLKKNYLYSLVYDGVKWQLVGDTSGIWEGNAETSTKTNALANLYDDSSRPTDANIAHVTNGGVTHFKATSAMTSNSPGSGNILHFHWDTSAAWDSQLFVPDGAGSYMRYRGHSSASTWYDWRTLLDSTNYSSYAVSAITSIDEVVPRFNGTTGQIQTSRMSINDNGLINFSYNGRYPGDIRLFNASNTRVAEYWYDTGNATNVTSGTFKWAEYSPNTTADTTTTGHCEVYSLPTVTAGLTTDKAYNILTTKDLSFSITGNAATATNSDKLDNLDSLDFLRNYHSNAAVGNIDALNTISYFYAHGDEGGFASGTNPGGNNGTAILHAHTHSGNYYTQLALDTARNALWVRSCNNATTFSNWLQVVTNSGSWNINVTGNAATATKATSDSDGNAINTTYAKLSGGLFTGNTSVKKASGYTYFESQRTDTGLRLTLEVDDSTHGIWSNGYVNNGTFTSSSRWLIYRNNTGNIIVNGDCTGNAATATEIKVTNATPTSYTLYYLTYTTSTTTGNQNLNNSPRLYWYDNGGSGKTSYLCIGSSDNNGGLTVRNANGKYANIITQEFDAIHTLTLPNETGTFALLTKADINTLINLLDIGSSILTGEDYIITQSVGGGTTTETYYRRKAKYIRVGGLTTARKLWGNNFDGTADVNGTISLGDEKRINAHITRKKEGGNGWAFTPLVIQDNANSDFAHIGVFGSANTLSYIYIGSNDYNGNNLRITSDGKVRIPVTTDASSKTTGALVVGGGIGAAGNIYGAKVYNAVWNDYAECREVETEESGYCVTETSNGCMIKTTKRLQPGCKITSDTFGTCMGETDKAKTPIAVAGRVLAYPYRNRSEYCLGAAVCSAPNGTVDIMTREEIMTYPERIVGTVSEIPTYEVWHGGNQDGKNDIFVNGRIWIYVR